MKVRVLSVLILVALLVAAVVPSVSAGAPTCGVYVRGFVWDMTNEIGVKGAVVELYRNDRTSGPVLVGKSTTESENGNFLIGISGTTGSYTLKVVELPDGVSCESISLQRGVGEPTPGGDIPLPFFDPCEFSFWLTPELIWCLPWADEAMCGKMFGPIWFNCVNETVIPIEPFVAPESVYIFGRVTDAEDCCGMPVEMCLRLEREMVILDGAGNEVGVVWAPVEEKGSNAANGYFGFGIKWNGSTYRIVECESGDVVVDDFTPMSDMYGPLCIVAAED